MNYNEIFKYQNELEPSRTQRVPKQHPIPWCFGALLITRVVTYTHCQVPVDLGDSHVKVQTEQNQQDSGHHKCTATHKLEEVEAFTRGTLHDGLYADERNQGQNLGTKIGNTHVCVYLVHSRGHMCLSHLNTTPAPPYAARVFLWGQQHHCHEHNLMKFSCNNRYGG